MMLLSFCLCQKNIPVLENSQKPEQKRTTLERTEKAHFHLFVTVTPLLTSEKRPSPQRF
jgi:hypothetical protein